MLPNYKLERKLFCYDYIIGKGGFGKVWKVEHLKTRNQYAMKEMLKSMYKYTYLELLPRSQCRVLSMRGSCYPNLTPLFLSICTIPSRIGIRSTWSWI